MKKVCVLAIMAILSAATFAQTKFGAKVGFAAANVTEVNDAGVRIGALVGGFAQVPLTLMGYDIEFMPELLYVMKGNKDDDGDKLKLNYIDVPLNFAYSLVEDVLVYVGPQVGFLLSSDYEGVDWKEDMNTIDFSVNIGGNYNLTEEIILDVRYCQGLSNLFNDNRDDLDGANNYSFQVSVGYRF